MFECKYCGEQFENKHKLGGHVPHCKQNPNYERSLEMLKKARSCRLTVLQSIDCECKYCGKITHNFGALKRHENACYLNPEHVITKKEIMLKKRQISKESGIKKHLSEEHKEKIRQSLQKWKNEHNEDYMMYCRKKSKCQENFKQYLKSKNIDFVEEYCPYPDERLFSLDIAWPDEKIAIEINGSQHYNMDGTLTDYTLSKQKFFNDKGWKIIQIYYKQCYGIIKDDSFKDVLSLPIYDKQYIAEDFNRKLIRQKILKDNQLKKDKERLENKQKSNNNYKQIFVDLEKNSGIDFTKFGWVELAKKFLLDNHNYLHHNLSRDLKKYHPEFFTNNEIFQRK